MSRSLSRPSVLPAALLVAIVGLSGCIASSTGGPTEPEPSQTAGDGIISAPHAGVQVELTMPAVLQPGQHATWQLTARHTGGADSAPFGYSSICHSPWQVRLADADGNALPWSEPIPECEAYGTAYLASGDSVGTTWDWDLRMWDATTGTYANLEPGSYSLTFLFEKQDEETGRGGGPSAVHQFTID